MWGPILAWCVAAAAGGVPAEVSEVKALDTKVVRLYREGLYADAERVARESLALREASDPDHPDMAKSLNNLAAMLHAQGRYAEARPLYERSIDIKAQALGRDHPDVATNLINLASLVAELGDYSEARKLFEEGLATKRAKLGPKHPDLPHGLINLAQLLTDLGESAKARALYEECLGIQLEVLGPDDARVAGPLTGLGFLLRQEGDYAAARQLYERSLAISRAALAPDHPQVASAMSNLAYLLEVQGDHDAARRLYEESLAIRVKTLGPDHPNVALGQNNLAALLETQGEYGAARSLYERSLATRRARFGPDHGYVATTLNNLAGVLEGEGDYDGAKAMYEESLTIWRAAMGPDHLDVGIALNNLAFLLAQQQDYTAARPIYEESLAIKRGALGSDDHRLAQTLNNFASLLEAQGEDKAARQLRDESLANAERHLDLLGTLSEREALAFLPTLRPTLDGWLAAFDQPHQAGEAWTHILQFKGVVAARQSEARAYALLESDDADLAAEHTAAQQELARLALADVDPEGLPERQEALSGLADRAERLERQLVAASASWAQARRTETAGIATLCEALPKRSAIVDFYEARIGDDFHYLAFLMSKRDCTVHRIDLGDSTALVDAALDWHEVLDDPDATLRRMQDRGARVTELLWDPLAPLLARARHVLVVPDGPLAAIPLGALPLDNGVLLDQVGISYLDRANDLLAPPPEGASGALIVGGVDFGSAAEVADDQPRSALAPCASRDWKRLPGSADEAESVAAQYADATQLSGIEATEEAVRAAMPGRAVVHLATHGFFASNAGCRSVLEGSGGVGYDPMLMSGIVLSGANQPADALSVQDGILTAAEVASVDLSNVGVVVLSACETGLGESRSGQGVLGLRRGFRVAGASSLVMSLFSVGDADTAVLMDQFYAELKRRHPVDALLRAQRIVRAENDDPRAWAGFIASGVPR